VITGETRLVGLLGDPVSGSLSPLMHNAAFAALGLDWAYVPLSVTAERLPEAVRGLVAMGFAGANVTTPHKLAAAELAESDVPSVNTLVVEGDRVLGFSTDVAVLDGLDAQRPVILGSGGSAAAFADALPQARRFSRSGGASGGNGWGTRGRRARGSRRTGRGGISALDRPARPR
jgi:shikimate dehydrogenase